MVMRECKHIDCSPVFVCCLFIVLVCFFCRLFAIAHVPLLFVFFILVLLVVHIELYVATVQSYVKVYAIRLFLEKVYQISILFKGTR